MTKEYLILIGLGILCVLILITSFQMIFKDSVKHRLSNYIAFCVFLFILLVVLENL